jgi:hypothetical protein
MIATRLLLMSVTTVIVGCTPPAASSHGDDGKSQLITEDEIEASRAPTAYDVIQKLRANFLTYRGEASFDKSTSQPYPTVYVDGQEYGSVGMLRNIPSSQVATIRFYRAWEATTKFGTGNMGGVIAITTRR